MTPGATRRCRDARSTTSIKETQRAATWHRTGREHLDAVVQHHIARGLAAGNLPSATIVDIAEQIGAADWKDRGLDVSAEIERLFAGLGAALTNPAAITASLQRSGSWVERHVMMQSWFEDDATVRALVEGRPRPKREVSVRRMLEEVLPTRRGDLDGAAPAAGAVAAGARRQPVAGRAVAGLRGAGARTAGGAAA